MAYNHKTAELIWKNKKVKEEALLRKLGYSEDKIKMLYDYDKETFNCDRRYGENEDVTKEGFFNRQPAYDKVIIATIEDLLDQIEDLNLLSKLKKADKVLLQILLLRFFDYEINEIAEELNMTSNAVRKRINKFRKKL